jgi:hypothetical protein
MTLSLSRLRCAVEPRSCTLPGPFDASERFGNQLTEETPSWGAQLETEPLFEPEATPSRCPVAHGQATG